jgi:hypothetical protein
VGGLPLLINGSGWMVQTYTTSLGGCIIAHGIEALKGGDIQAVGVASLAVDHGLSLAEAFGVVGFTVLAGSTCCL